MSEDNSEKQSDDNNKKPREFGKEAALGKQRANSKERHEATVQKGKTNEGDSSDSDGTGVILPEAEAESAVNSRESSKKDE